MRSDVDHVITILAGELHLVPLKKILQLHPDFGYLDKAVMGDQKMAREREGIRTQVFRRQILQITVSRKV